MQFHAGQIGTGENLADGGIDSIEIRGADETLNQRDVGRCVASRAKPFGSTSSRRLLTAAACRNMVASGSSKMSMAVIGLFWNANTVFQSCFMLTTVQPSFFA